LLLLPRRTPISSLFPYTTLFRSDYASANGEKLPPRKFVPMVAHSKYLLKITGLSPGDYEVECLGKLVGKANEKALAAGINLNTLDRKSTRLNSSHVAISYAVFCL